MARSKKKKLGLAQPLSKAGKQKVTGKNTVEASLVSSTGPDDQIEERPAKRVKWSGTRSDSKTAAKLVKGPQNTKPSSKQPEAKKAEPEKTDEPLKPVIRPDFKLKESKRLDKHQVKAPPKQAPQPPKVIGQPAQDSMLGRLTLALHESHNVATLSIISSSAIQKKVAKILSHLSSSTTGTKPPLVILSAKAGVASKAISIAEIAKREIGKAEGRVWFQYSALEGVIFERTSKPSKREKREGKRKAKLDDAKATEPLGQPAHEAVGDSAEKAKEKGDGERQAESLVIFTEEVTRSITVNETGNEGERTESLAPSNEEVTTSANTAERAGGSTDVIQDDEDEDSAFETMQIPVSKITEVYNPASSILDEKKVRAVPILTIFISRARIEALKTEYG